jgi:nucleoside-diphosphate-sugar epimerase
VTRLLVTGGSGYFGSVLVDRALARDCTVRILDLNPPEPREGADVEVVLGDVRDQTLVRAACEGVDIVHHNVAQVPLARDRDLFWTVNVVGTANVLLGARDAGVAKVVSTSSSAVYGIPEANPVDEQSPRRPLEAYGRAKLQAEDLCSDAAAAGLDVSIVRPRTILGHGRLGIMAILFDLVAEGAPIFVLDGGRNRYQFVHADDLAEACLQAGERAGAEAYNVGATEFGTMRETLEALCAHAPTGARVRSLPSAPARLAMRVASAVGQAPFAPYHWLLYGESLWFDTSKARTELGWEPQHSNTSMVIESYEWYLAHRGSLLSEGRSHHQSPARTGLLGVLKRLP